MLEAQSDNVVIVRNTCKAYIKTFIEIEDKIVDTYIYKKSSREILTLSKYNHISMYTKY